MILPDKKDAIHKAWLYRVLEGISDNLYLSGVLFFKGGTCASMLGWLDRFSVDLDFDYSGDASSVAKTRAALEVLFENLGLSVKDQSKRGIQYFLKYDNLSGSSKRNTLKIDVTFPLISSSQYKPQRLSEIDRVLTCQTVETMFGHKLVAVVDRYEKTDAIAGRDIYDIHHFFLKGYRYSESVIQERRGTTTKKYFKELLALIDQKVTDKMITEDLSYLLPEKQFMAIRKVLKREVMSLIGDAFAGDTNHNLLQ